MGNKSVVHGALDFSELEKLGLAPAEIIDFSVNSNPYGPSPLARAALITINIERYPDRECLDLRRAILTYDIPDAALSLNEILCGNGTAELIWATARAFLRPGSKAAIVGPTFGEYRQASQVAGARVVEFRSQASAQFRPDLTALLNWLEEEAPDLLWFCNPNNPTGYILPEPQLRRLEAFCRVNRITLVLDEAYQRFVVGNSPFSGLDFIAEEDPAGLVVLRSLTKDYALAGLRLGYAASNAPALVLIASQLPSWNVSAPAQVVGAAALQDQAYLHRTLAALKAERAEFFTAIERAGLEFIPSDTHYGLVKVGDARETRRRLLEEKLLVRDCTSFGLPGYIRVATRPRAEWERLVKALKRVILPVQPS
ncbi:MAG: histidinol-phosphate aminotransferase family protein [Chloroflexi bacterium]|nr:histidinol-phosphate aminotransferase family protein [Chloroflexota bacterium]